AFTGNTQTTIPRSPAPIPVRLAAGTTGAGLATARRRALSERRDTTTDGLSASRTSTRRNRIGIDVRFVTCSSYESSAPESLTATVGGFGTRNSIDGGICCATAARAVATSATTTAPPLGLTSHRSR